METHYDFWIANANAYAILYEKSELFHYYKAYRHCLKMAQIAKQSKKAA
jgi:poly(A) polymerase Pap1